MEYHREETFSCELNAGCCLSPNLRDVRMVTLLNTCASEFVLVQKALCSFRSSALCLELLEPEALLWAVTIFPSSS